jgi:hypothetical protein
LGVGGSAGAIPDVGVCVIAIVAVGVFSGASGVMKTGGAVGEGGWKLDGLSATIRLRAMLNTTITLSITEKMRWLRWLRALFAMAIYSSIILWNVPIISCP